MATPISSRPTDYLYRCFFAFMLVIALLVDCSPLYPEYLRPAFVGKLHKYQFETFKDPFYNVEIHRPWFQSLISLELLVLVPFNAWLIYGLTIDHPLVPLVLLMDAYHIAVTTIPCVAEIYADTSLSTAEVLPLLSMYGPYAVFPIYMVWDACSRIQKQLYAQQRIDAAVKAK